MNIQCKINSAITFKIHISLSRRNFNLIVAPKSIMNHPQGTVNISTKFHDNLGQTSRCRPKCWIDWQTSRQRKGVLPFSAVAFLNATLPFLDGLTALNFLISSRAHSKSVFQASQSQPHFHVPTRLKCINIMAKVMEPWLQLLSI